MTTQTIQNLPVDVAAVIGALDAGKLPSHQQVTSFIDVALNSDLLKVDGALSGGTLSANGQKIVQDVREILQAYKELGNETNSALTL